jgi:hypothetical protein
MSRTGLSRLCSGGALLVLGLLQGSCGGGGGAKITVSVSGTATYEDRAYNRNGFTGQTPQLPIRFATVQLMDESNAVLTETRTSASGAYSITAEANEGENVHVAVAAMADGTYNVRVVNNSQHIYALASAPFTVSAAPKTQDLAATTGNLGGVFNILDTVIRASDLLLALRPGATFPLLSVLWFTGSTDGTFFTADNEMHLLGQASDPDEYDDDVIMHEFGHYIAHNFSWDTSPGGNHNPFDDIPESPPLAWSEGFAHWWTTAARNTPEYVDNNADGFLFFELETPTEPAITRGNGNEIAVGAILWDITDPANEPFDAMNNQRGPLWDVVGTFFPDTRPSSTIDAFCSGWVSRGHGQLGALGAIFANRGIRCP